ncbi:energy transducer TonB [Pedobacter ureilyticus]|uniref:Energy transducer TonB n=1 Tax=Pedobacter ureilyticus TaxID=1393051 RepID=A0ABW9J4X7_9SPHI|nr:energy transducer TonB [Pedobacter helvus]
MITKYKLTVVLIFTLSTLGFAQNRKPDYVFKLGTINYFMNLSKGNAKAQNDTLFYNLYRNGSTKRIAKEIKHIVNRNTGDTLQAGYYVVLEKTISFFQTFKAKKTTQRVYTQNVNGLLSVKSGVLTIDPPKMPIPPMAPAADNTGYPEQVDIPAEFPGGMARARQFIGNNLEYPKKAIDAEIEGTVQAKFTIELDGSISNIEIVRSLGYGCDEEVIRVIKRMPKWAPAKRDGKAVKSYITMPISFNLN